MPLQRHCGTNLAVNGILRGSLKKKGVTFQENRYHQISDIED